MGKKNGGRQEPLTVHELQRTVDIWQECGESVRATAEKLGVHRSTIRKRLKRAGEAKLIDAVKRKPISHGTKVYVLTSAQDDTPIFKKFWDNLMVYVGHRDAELMIGGYTYQKGLFEDHNVRTGVFDPRLAPYMVTDKQMIGPNLMWIGDANILPTAVNPLSGYETMSREAWAIIPHARIRLQSVPVGPGIPPKQIMSTGTVTDPNYVQRSAGKKAEFHHTAGAVVVEVMSDGTFFCRHINAASDGSFYDLNVFVSNGVLTTNNTVEAISWGDIHLAKLDPQVAAVNWMIDGNIIDTLKPKFQFMHDLLDFEARNHHNRADPHFRATMDAGWGHNRVEAEIAECSKWLKTVDRPFCQTVVVESNHDQALMRWVKDPKVSDDHSNARYWHELNAEIYRNIEKGERGFNVFEYACRELSPDRLDGVAFITGENSFRICQGTNSPIECSIHGHVGTNGSRGSAVQYAKIGTKMNVGHAHSPAIIEGVFQAGVSGKLDMGYNSEGLSSWMHTHIVTYPNAKRALITISNGRWHG